MVCVGGAPQPAQAPDVIKVSEEYPADEEPAPFDPKDVVRIRTNAKFEQFYEIDGEPIGEGKFGKVYRCVEKSNGLELAAKFIKIRKDADRQQVEHEVAVMTQMRHPRIAQIYDAFYSSKNDVILVMELVKGGELFNRVVEDNYVLTEQAAVMIICQLCEAISYIHSQNIVHLDIKPENIMCVSESGNRIKLIDFGLARHYDGSEDLYYMAGTPEFSAPEVIKFEPLDFHTDMWSVGVITYILLSGYSPFLGETTPLTYCNVERGEWEFIEEFDCVSEVAKDFISKLLIYNKSERMLPKECLAHPWLAKVRERAQKDALLDQPNTGQAINTAKLKRYNIRRKFRKATLAVMSYNEFTQILGVLRKKKSEKGLEYFGKAKVEPKKKKRTLESAVLAAKNQEQEVAKKTKADEEAVLTKPEPVPLVTENLDTLKVEKKMQKTESSDSAKENKNSQKPPSIAAKESPKKILGSSEVTSAANNSLEVPKKRKSVKKKTPTAEAEEPMKVVKTLKTAASADNILQSDDNTKKPPLKKTVSTPLAEKESVPVRRKSIKKPADGTTTKSVKSESVSAAKVVVDGAEKTSTIKKTVVKKENGETVKKVADLAGKSPSTSRGSFDVPKPPSRVNSLIAERLQKLNADAPPLTFNVSGKKQEPTVHVVSTEKVEQKEEPPRKKVVKEVAVVTEKKSTTTTTTSVKSKVENSEKKFLTSTGDKNIEETNRKSSTQQQVKVSSVTTAEEKCPETGKPKKTVKKSVAKREKTEKEEEKNRLEVEKKDDRTMVRTQKTLQRESGDKAVLERLTKVDGQTTDDKKLELSTVRLKKVAVKATHDASNGKMVLQDAELKTTTKMKRMVKGKDNEKEEEKESTATARSTVSARRPKEAETQPRPSLLKQLSSARAVSPEPPRSALKKEGDDPKKRKAVKLSEIILPHVKLEEDKGASRVRFADNTVNPKQPKAGGFGLMKGKSEGNIAAKVKSNLNISVKQKTQDDGGVKRRDHWLFAASEESVRPREDFSFSSLKEKLERRVLGVSADLRPPKETIKIPGASFAINKWKQLEQTG